MTGRAGRSRGELVEGELAMRRNLYTHKKNMRAQAEECICILDLYQ